MESSNYPSTVVVKSLQIRFFYRRIIMKSWALNVGKEWPLSEFQELVPKASAAEPRRSLRRQSGSHVPWAVGSRMAPEPGEPQHSWGSVHSLVASASSKTRKDEMKRMTLDMPLCRLTSILWRRNFRYMWVIGMAGYFSGLECYPATPRLWVRSPVRARTKSNP